MSNDAIEQNESISPKPDAVSQLKERARRTQDLREKLELHAANRLCVPLYELRETPPDELPDDTLSRIERLMQRPKVEYWEDLIGGIYRLASKNEFLVVLIDGTGMKISVSEDKDTEKIFYQQKIAITDLYRRIKENPVLELTLHRGKLEYRTDDPYLSTEKIMELLGKDWKEAQQIILELQNRKAENLDTSLEILTSKLPNDNTSPNDNTDNT